MKTTEPSFDITGNAISVGKSGSAASNYLIITIFFVSIYSPAWCRQLLCGSHFILDNAQSMSLEPLGIFLCLLNPTSEYNRSAGGAGSLDGIEPSSQASPTSFTATTPQPAERLQQSLNLHRWICQSAS